MNISYRWLQKFLEFPLSPEETSKILTSIGLEVESVESYQQIKGGLEGLIVGEVLHIDTHPNAQKLKITTIDIAAEKPLQIVCGANNVAVGQKVIVAVEGTILYPTTGKKIEIKKADLRGVLSEGMLCAEDEIGISTSHEGIAVLPMHAKPGEAVKNYFEIYNDHIFSIGLTPNRADAASHYGVARDLFAAISIQMPALQIALAKPNVNVFFEETIRENYTITINNTDACPRYAGVLLENIKVGPSPIWLQNTLNAIELSPINNVVDITNYVLHAFGQPLHAFDADKISSGHIIIQNAKAEEKFTTLDGKERVLKSTDLVVYDGNTPIAMAGIMGGLNTAVSNTTTNVFLESAYFSPSTIRLSSQLHDLKTDASFRFERGADPNMVIYALKYACMLMCEVAHAKIASNITDHYSEKIQYFNVPVSFSNIHRLCGNVIKNEMVFEILEALEINISGETEAGFVAHVPPYRIDVQREVDVIEEIIRIYGFENISLDGHEGTSFFAPQPTLNIRKIQNKWADILVSNGFNEIMTNSLTNPEYYDQLTEYSSDSGVKIINKLSPELSVLRQHMLFTGLEALSYNLNRRQKNLLFFELGKTYKKIHKNGNTVGDYAENSVFACYFLGNISHDSWEVEAKKVDFFYVKKIMTMLLQSINVSNIEFEQTQSELFIDGIALKSSTRKIGECGEVKPSILKKHDLKTPVWYADIDMETALQFSSQCIVYEQVTKFPEVKRDLSLVLDQAIDYSQLLNIAQQTGGKLLKSMHATDVYTGEKIDEGKKSYTLHFILADDHETLTDAKTDEIMQKLMHAYELKVNALIRK